MRTNWQNGVYLTVGLILSAHTAVASPLADPTQPAHYRAPASGPSTVAHARGPVLQSTFVAPGHKRAVIDGNSVGVGDKVNGAQVVDIRPYEVVLRQGSRQTSLRLMPQLIRQQKVASQ